MSQVQVRPLAELAPRPAQTVEARRHFLHSLPEPARERAALIACDLAV